MALSNPLQLSAWETSWTSNLTKRSLWSTFSQTVAANTNYTLDNTGAVGCPLKKSKRDIAKSLADQLSRCCRLCNGWIGRNLSAPAYGSLQLKLLLLPVGIVQTRLFLSNDPKVLRACPLWYTKGICRILIIRVRQKIHLCKSAPKLTICHRCEILGSPEVFLSLDAEPPDMFYF